MFPNDGKPKVPGTNILRRCWHWLEVEIGHKGKYDLEKVAKLLNHEKPRRSILVRTCRRVCGLFKKEEPGDRLQELVQALYDEDFLVCRLGYMYDHNRKEFDKHYNGFEPALAVGNQFSDHELRRNTNARYRSRRRTTVDVKFDPWELQQLSDTWLMAGLDSVRIERLEDEPSVDNLPESTWFAVIVPALKLLITLKTGRQPRSNITIKRKQTPRNVLVHHGDVHRNFFVVANMPNDNNGRALQMFAIFAHRIAELGERQRRTRNPRITDAVIQFPTPCQRTQNKNRTKTTRASHFSQNSTSETSLQPEIAPTRAANTDNPHFQAVIV